MTTEHNEILELRARVAELEGLVNEARELLGELEWQGGIFWVDETCPVCEGSHLSDHAPDCRLAAFLAETAPCPTVEEMVGIAPDFTGGLSSEEYVRRLRDA